MAKPKSPSTSSSTHSRSPRHTTTPSSPHSLSPRQANIAGTHPSSTLLVLLATVAASSSTADGRPLNADSQPPDFLCPLLASDAPGCGPSKSRFIDDVDTKIYHLSPSPTRNKRAGTLPVKFQQGDDGIWRKEPNWSLYGSTHCDTGVPAVDDQIDPTLVSTPTASTSHTSESIDMSADLPPGWKKSDTGKDISAYILALSICLAIFICGTIFGCVGWRRKRRGLTAKDYEKRLRKQILEDCDSDQDVEEIKRARTSQKLWTKASTKWRAGVRASARRRRKRAPASVPAEHEPRMSTESLASRSSFTTSAAPAPISVGSSTPLDAEDTSSTITPSRDPQDAPSSNSASGPTDPSRPAQPPQYPEDAVYHRRSSLDNGGTHAVNNSATTSHETPETNDPEIPYVPSVSGHIATDDKTLLSRLATLASSPPSDSGSSFDTSHTETPSVAGPSVPILDEVERGAIDLHLLNEQGPSEPSSTEVQAEWNRMLLSTTRSATSELSVLPPAPIYSRESSPHPPLHPPFPPPPTKAQLFYEYPSSFEEDVEGMDPIPIPSAPPFDFVLSPSAPPVDDFEAEAPDAMPCAPPLIDADEELQLGLGTTAPTAGPSWTPSPHTSDGDMTGHPMQATDDGSDPPADRRSCQHQTLSGPLRCTCAQPSTSRLFNSPDAGAPSSTPPTARGRSSSPPDYLP
ncbi:hypothetical protein BDW22DRAFT_1340987 [Trametopsis cervina]|nr:hypothetical protein BDW22DRAFT_1340987 [Trametopsis cervina]